MPSFSPPEPQIRSGTVTFTVAAYVVNVTFTIPMPSANYDLYWRTPAIAANVTATNKTANGFTINLATGLAMSLDWIAREIRS